MHKLAFLFPGQGPQYPGMGKDLFNRSSTARRVFEEGSDSLGIDMRALCFDSDVDSLAQPANAAPAILVFSIAAYRCFREAHPHIVPPFMAGHSMGEYSALVAAGVLQFGDAMKIVKKRGLLMQQVAINEPGRMYSVSGITSEKVEEVCTSLAHDGGQVGIACFNSPLHTIISGNIKTVEKAAHACELAGAKATCLQVSLPSHSILMHPAAERLREYLVNFTFSTPHTTVIANINGQPYSNNDDFAKKLSGQLAKPVLWSHSMDFMLDRNTTYFLDIGPGKMLKSILQTNARAKKFSLDEEDGEVGFSQVVNKNIMTLSSVVTRCLSCAVAARNTNWNEEDYNRGVSIPYRQLQSLQEQLEKDLRMPAEEEAVQSLRLLEQILRTKGIKEENIDCSIQEVLKDTGAAIFLPS